MKKILIVFAFAIGLTLAGTVQLLGENNSEGTVTEEKLTEAEWIVKKAEAAKKTATEWAAAERDPYAIPTYTNLSSIDHSRRGYKFLYEEGTSYSAFDGASKRAHPYLRMGATVESIPWGGFDSKKGGMKGGCSTDIFAHASFTDNPFDDNGKLRSTNTLDGTVGMIIWFAETGKKYVYQDYWRAPKKTYYSRFGLHLETGYFVDATNDKGYDAQHHYCFGIRAAVGPSAYVMAGYAKIEDLNRNRLLIRGEAPLPFKNLSTKYLGMPTLRLEFNTAPGAKRGKDDVAKVFLFFKKLW